VVNAGVAERVAMKLAGTIRSQLPGADVDGLAPVGENPCTLKQLHTTGG
jgi:hypothetical protein